MSPIYPTNDQNTNDQNKIPSDTYGRVQLV